ncbi:MAG: lamin tail domain-containing protein [Candidatus Omnitrophota bacterium]
MKRFALAMALAFGLCSISYSAIVINEIMYNPKGDEANGEYIELYNSSANAVDASGWKLSGAIDYTLPPSTAIDAKGFLAVCRNEQFIRANYALDSSVKTTGNFAPSKLSNSGERIQLLDRNDNEIDAVSYSDKAPWPRDADGNGPSLELIYPLADNNNALYWSANQVPTPGRPNSRLLAAAPPLFLSISRSPLAPASSQETVISVRFENPSDLSSLILTYTANGGAAQTLNLAKTGDVFEGRIPPQSTGALVEYTITSVSQSGSSIVLPGGSARYLYLVDNQPIAPGAVVINEIMYNNPSADGEDKEWIELFNPTAQAIDLSYWILKDDEDAHEFRLAPGTSITSQGFLLIAHSKELSWTAPVVEGLPFSLNDGGDSVRLFDVNERLIAEVDYNDTPEWPWGADGEGGSLELQQASRPNNEPNNWGVSPQGGTPGLPNIKAIADPAYHDYDIVINEIFYHPSNEEYDSNVDNEYIELFNRSAQVIDLSGWFFSNGVEFRFPQGTSLAAGGTVLVCKKADRYPNVPNRIGDYMLQLNNGGEAIALMNANGVVIDYVNYNDRMPWPIRPDGDGTSLELVNAYADNRDGQYWRNGQPNSPGAPNSAAMVNTPPRITRIQHTPQYPAASVSEERVETINIIKTGQNWRYFKGKSEPPSNWRALDFDASSWLEGPSGFGFGDNDDATVLSDMQNAYYSVYIRKEFDIADPTGFTIMQLGVDYDDGFVAYLNGVEIARSMMTGALPAYNQFSDGNHEAGTMEFFDASAFIKSLRKGKNVLALQGHNANATSSDFSLIPQLDMQRIMSAGEEGSDKIIVSARVRDDDGIGEVVLHYQRLSSPYGAGLALGDWKTVRMMDDGTHGDLAAGDSVYAFTLNEAEEINPGEIWRYMISTKDAKGAEAYSPLQDELTRNYAFFVEDPLERSHYPSVYLFMERSVMNWLTQNPDSNQEQKCLVVADGEVYDLYNAGGVHYRGDGGKPEKSWKIQFVKGNRWRDRRIMNLDADYQTSPLLRGEAGFLEYLSYDLFRQMNQPAANAEHCRLIVNNAYYGFFINTEQYNEDFLNHHDLPAETLLFRAGVKSRRSYLAPEPDFETYAQKYESMIGRDDDIQPLINFIEGLNSAQDAKTFIEANVNVDLYLNYLALVAVLSHADSAEMNYLLARGADGRWFMLPEEMSHTWGEIPTNSAFPLISNFPLLNGAEGGVYGVNTLCKKFLEIPEYRSQYFQRLRDFTDRVFTREHLDPLFDSYWSYLKDAVSENTQRWSSPGQLSQMIAELKKYGAARREFILADPSVRPVDIPSKPKNLFPAEGELISTRGLTLRTETISKPMGKKEAQWEIQTLLKDFFQPLWSGELLSDTVDSFDLPPGVLASNATYYWRMRYRGENGVWSDWSDAASFRTTQGIPPPEVQNALATPLDGAARLEWTEPLAADLIRVDIFDGADIVESAKITNNRVRIADLKNGKEYVFIIRTVSADGQVSNGVTVKVTPQAPASANGTIAYFRFEGNGADSGGAMGAGELLGSASITAPGAENPVSLTQTANLASLNLDGTPGSGFRFGANNEALNVNQRLTLECYALAADGAQKPSVLIDRYDEASAAVNGVWRFGLGLSQPGSLDFFFNDANAASGFGGRLHFASRDKAVPNDGVFHHYAVVVDLRAPLAGDKIRLYRDGEPIASQIVNDDGFSSYNEFRQDSRLPVLVGARRTSVGTADALNGKIDEVRLTGEALSPKEFLHPPVQTDISDWTLY